MLYTFLYTCPSNDLIQKILYFYILLVFLSQYSFWSHIQRYSDLSSILVLLLFELLLFRSSAFLLALEILKDRPRHLYMKILSFYTESKFEATHFIYLYFLSLYFISHQSFFHSIIILDVHLLISAL